MPDSTAISTLLGKFEPIYLHELDKFELMNRIDTKYLFSAEKVESILGELGPGFKVLEIDGRRIFPYVTTYLDTPGWSFFNQHIKQRGERNKVRFRKYEQTGVTFLEVKKRNNKLRTEKWRITKDLAVSGGLDEESSSFIKKYVEDGEAGLNPVLVNRFLRITLAGIETGERVTIDMDLSFSDLSGNTLSYPGIAILERKRPGSSSRSPLTMTLKKNAVYPAGFSKYCFGTAMLYDIPGKNALKPRVLQVNKIINDSNKIYNAGQFIN